LNFAELIDADTYVPGDANNQKKRRLAGIKSQDLIKILHSVDRQMRNLILIAEQRRIPPTLIFSHEFTQALLSLCNISNCHLMNQQKKSMIIDFFKRQHSMCFFNVCPNMNGIQALIIDGGSLLEIKPAGRSMTVRQYADQLFKMVSDEHEVL
jgi:hypothetical protein